MTSKIYFFLCIALGFLLAGCWSNQPAETTVLHGSIDSYSILFENLSRIPKVDEQGVMVGMIDGDEVAVAVIGNNTFTEDTLFEFGSITKVMTAHILAQLAVEGLIDIHGPLNDHLPESFQSSKWENTTILELASHVSGIPENPPGTSRSAEMARTFDRDALAAAMDSTHVNNSREMAIYNCCYSYIILGLVIEEATGLSYAEAVQERLFDPMGMETASIHGWQGDDIAPPLNVHGKPSWFTDFDQAAPAGALRGSVSDLLAFLDASIHACNGDDIVAQGTCLSQNSNLRPTDSASTSWGLGWQFFKDDTFGHGGQTDGFQAFIAVSPNREKGIIVVTNATSLHGLDGQVGSWVLRDHSISEN